MGRRQSQESGDNSVNLQGRDITVGLSYFDARQVAMDVFEANFLRLRDVAAEVARKRAESLLDDYLKEMAKEGQAEIPEAESPDLQYAVFSAQKEYARTGDEDLGELLVQLLVDRTKERDRNLVQIVLNESLAVAPKLTPDQLDALSLIFLLKYTVHEGLNSLVSLDWYLDKYILPFVPGASRKQSAYQHLEFAGCGTVSIGEVKSEQAFLNGYPGLLCEGFTEEELQTVELTPEERSQLITRCVHNDSLLQVSVLNDKALDSACAQFRVDHEKAQKLKELQASKLMPPPKVREYFVGVQPQMTQFFEVWDDTPMKNMTLTSVGIAIAHANIQKRTGETFDLSIWM